MNQKVSRDYFMLQDSHCHLYMLPDNELKRAVENAKKEGVSTMVSNSTSFQSNQYNLRIAKNFPAVLPALGLYPLDAMELSEEEVKKAVKWIGNKAEQCVAFGEIGIDYKYAKKRHEKEKQEKVFREFIRLGKKHDKPIIVHSRYAQRQVLEILGDEDAKKVLLHSFVDSPKLMKASSEKGFFVSVGLAVLENEEMQERVRDFPLESLLLETDAPLLFSGEKSLPSHIKKVAKKISELKALPVAKIEEQAEKNFRKLFGNPAMF